MSKKKQKLWKAETLLEIHDGSPGEAKKVFRKLANRARKLMEEKYEEIFEEDFDVTQLLLAQAGDCHVYHKMPEEEGHAPIDFFFMSPSKAEVKHNQITGKEEGHVSIECRYPA